MRCAKKNPKVISITCGPKQLTDNSVVYTEDMWPHGQFDELIERGFLIEEKEQKPVDQNLNPPPGDEDKDLGKKNKKV